MTTPLQHTIRVISQVEKGREREGSKRPLARIVVVTLLHGEFTCFLPTRDWVGSRETRAAIRASTESDLSNLAEQATTNDEGYRFQLPGKTTNRIEEAGKNHLKLLPRRPLLLASQVLR